MPASAETPDPSSPPVSKPSSGDIHVFISTRDGLQIQKKGLTFPDKVWRALNYFYNFWDQIFAYRHDGEYSIDNTFISTCQQKCRNFRDFFVDYVRAWNRGRRDFGRSSLSRLLQDGRKNLVKLAFNPTTN